MKPPRLPVVKTYKLFVGGSFIRSESGRSWLIRNRNKKVIAHLCLASVADWVRAVEAAIQGQEAWARQSAYHRGQVLYGMAAMLEGQADAFTEALQQTVPGGQRRARKEVEAAIDRLLCFAGWADKYDQVLGCHNPVAGPFYNFTVSEALGVVAVVAAKEEPLLAMVSQLAPVLVGGNAAVVLGSETHPLATALFGEVCSNSDVPPGVVNLLTGKRKELLESVAMHRGVDGIAGAQCSHAERTLLESGVAENLKRVSLENIRGAAWHDVNHMHGPDRIQAFLNMKTIWHPAAN